MMLRHTMIIVTVKMKNVRVRGAFSNSLTSSSEKVVSSVFAIKQMVRHPIWIKIRAGKSYLRMNFSPRIKVDHKIVAMIPLAELAAKRVRSMYWTK